MIGPAPGTDYPAVSEADHRRSVARPRGHGVVGAQGGWTGDTLAISVHGPVGVLDLVVPAGAAATDVAREYAAQSRLGAIPLLHTGLGQVLRPDVALVDAGVGTGDVLVATTGVPRPVPRGRGEAAATTRRAPGPLAGLWCSVAAACALLAGWFAAQTASDGVRTATIGLLLGAALVGVIPWGGLARSRALVAPVFAAAASLAGTWDPTPERLPMVLGLAAMAAAVTAAVARTVAPERDEVLTVWMAAGSTVFVFTGLGAVLGASPQTLWALLLVTALLAARYVPGLAVDVPDDVLLDLDRLAVTAWSARDTRRGHRSRLVVRRPAVTAIVDRGARIVAASCAGILVVAAVSAPMLLTTAVLPIDRTGARGLVFFAGAGLLFAARSHRHTPARILLRCAGLVCWLALAVLLLGWLARPGGLWLSGVAAGLATILVLAAVATGRGWRSVWWARRAEVGEALSGAFAVAAVCVASGLSRTLWEFVSTVFKG